MLELDKKNFNAYLLLGAANQDNNPADAAKYLKQAITCTTDPTFAYMGLLKCASHDEIPEICQKLLKCAPAKYAAVYQKLETAALISKHEHLCIEIIDNDLGKATDATHINSAYSSLLVIFLQASKVNERWTKLYRNTLEHGLKDPSANNYITIFRKYLKLLYTQKRFVLVLPKCVELLASHPNEEIPLEIICKVYADTFEAGDFDLNSLITEGIGTYADDLLKLNSTSPFGLLAKGLNFFAEQRFVDARDALNNANNVSKFNVLCLKMLAKTHYKLGAYPLAEYYYSHGKCETVELVTSLVEQRNEKKCVQALEISQRLIDSLKDSEKIELDEAIAKAHLLLEKQEDAEKVIGQLPAHEGVTLLRAFQFKLENQNEKAMEMLQSVSFESSKYFLSLAQCHFDAQHYQEALSFALIATKLEPYNSNCYFWLGQIYTINGDTERARKCFEKCVFLNPQHEQGVILLSNIYRQFCEWDLNLNLLQKAAEAIPNTACKWATLQLGFHNLSQNKFEDAIGAFRTCLRLDPNDLPSWEGLADSYLKRGSFSSALKIYKKICELTNNKFYPRLQVANIKSTLRYYNDAVGCYEELLKEEPSSVPVLKGIGDAHLCLAKQCFDMRWLGRAKYHINEAVKHLINAIHVQSNFVCLWRLLANSFDLAALFPTGEAEITVPGSLANESANVITLKGEQLYDFASKFYSRALKINSGDEYLWYELATNYYNRVTHYQNADTKMKHLELATAAIKHAIKLTPNRWKNWNLLGVISTMVEVNNPRLAQHCFIKALEFDKKNAVVWSNLGVFYLSKGMQNITLANAAFTHAQQSEPSYSTAWTGQALIAELVDSIEIIDLFKHSLSLSYGDEATMRYAHWVCTFLNNTASNDWNLTKSNNSRLRYAMENMHALPTALDSMTWYCRSRGDEVSAEALTFLGFLYFKQQHWKNAIKTFKKALEKIENSQSRDKLLCNLAYCYLKNDDALEAIDAFGSVSEATFHSSIGLALAFFKAKQYESSYQTYQSTLEYLAHNDNEKSLILIAIASMVYVFQGENDAKSVLFQCIGLAEPPIEALLSACSLGILHDDMPLSQLVLKELTKHEGDPKWCEHISFLRAQLYVKLNQTKQALLYLYSQVHIYPDRPQLRKLLATFLLQNGQKNDKDLMASKRMVEGTIQLQRKYVNRMTSMDIAKLLALASEATRCINQHMSRKLAQKAVHINPSCKEAWSAQAAITT